MREVLNERIYDALLYLESDNGGRLLDQLATQLNNCYARFLKVCRLFAWLVICVRLRGCECCLPVCLPACELGLSLGLMSMYVMPCFLYRAVLPLRNVSFASFVSLVVGTGVLCAFE